MLSFLTGQRRDNQAIERQRAMNPAHYIDRELSWLEFNQRVLDSAADSQVPLMERVKFLAISASNLDEFFRVRMGTLRSAIRRDLYRISPSGLTPHEQLQACNARSRRMFEEQYRVLNDVLLPELEQAGLKRLLPEQLVTAQQRYLKQVFEKELFSIVTPAAVESAEEFPHLPNEHVHLCVRLDRPAPFAVIPVAASLPRFIIVPADGGVAYVLLEDVLARFASLFFPQHQVLECVAFRGIRNAELELQEFSPAGLAAEMAEALQERSDAELIRLDLASHASEETSEFLRQAMQLAPEAVFRLEGPLELGALMQLASQPGFDKLRYEPWPPVTPSAVPSDQLLVETISEKDVLLYHPFESYDPVIRLLEEAAEDPEVLAIKQTLYRVSRDSRIVQALLRAVQNGKHVTVLVELKARFDEARNLRQARELELAGAHVIWGVKGFKTHAKLCIIVKRTSQGIQRCVHFGTGNYNEVTARLYTDASYLTTNEDLGSDAVAFFNAISGLSHPQKYRRLEAAPVSLRDALLDLIQSEAKRAAAKQEARILVKVNALVDEQLIAALYDASRAGVEIQLNVRGICCLRPGVPGLSENIRVISIVDRFLEHARILYFHHGGAGRTFISSADWMPRNLDLRQELLVPVDDPASRKRLLSILNCCLADNTHAWELQSDGSYRRLSPGDQPAVRSQEELYLQAKRALKTEQRRKRTAFEPHRPTH